MRCFDTNNIAAAWAIVTVSGVSNAVNGIEYPLSVLTIVMFSPVIGLRVMMFSPSWIAINVYPVNGQTKKIFSML